MSGGVVVLTPGGGIFGVVVVLTPGGGIFGVVVVEPLEGGGGVVQLLQQ